MSAKCLCGTILLVQTEDIYVSCTPIIKLDHINIFFDYLLEKKNKVVHDVRRFIMLNLNRYNRAYWCSKFKTVF